MSDSWTRIQADGELKRLKKIEQTREKMRAAALARWAKVKAAGGSGPKELVGVKMLRDHLAPLGVRVWRERGAQYKAGWSPFYAQKYDGKSRRIEAASGVALVVALWYRGIIDVRKDFPGCYQPHHDDLRAAFDETGNPYPGQEHDDIF